MFIFQNVFCLRGMSYLSSWAVIMKLWWTSTALHPAMYQKKIYSISEMKFWIKMTTIPEEGTEMVESPPAVDHAPTFSLDDEFTCGICFELMVLPTSLNCGHSFCRPCLASWVVSSHRIECPSCRQKFYGYHNLNFVIRFVHNYFVFRTNTLGFWKPDNVLLTGILVKNWDSNSKDDLQEWEMKVFGTKVQM